MSCCKDHENDTMDETMNQTHSHSDSDQVVYTCPMHPEVVEDKPGRCPKCGMDLEEVKKNAIGSHMDHMLHGSAKDFLKRFWIVTFLLIPLLLLSEPVLKLMGVSVFAFQQYIEFALATVIFGFSLVFFKHAKHEIKAKQYGMMTLVSLAVGAGYLFSAAGTFFPSIQTQFYLEISTLIWVLLFGHYLEAKSGSAAGDALKEVAKLLPHTTHLIEKNGKTRDISVSELSVGDKVLVKPGEKIPADGVITEGSANIDESVITGESKPVKKGPKDKVVAGSICLDGSLELKIQRVGKNSTVGQIHALIAHAQTTKPQTQLLANKASKWLTFVALSVAIIAFLTWSLVVGETFVFSMTLAITVLVIACPHALGLAIPTVTTITTALATENGLFIKDLGKLERIKDLDYIMMDKTGTLTKGEFGVTEVITLDGISKNDILKIAASIEMKSSHVIGASIVKFAKQKDLKISKVTGFKNIAGMGVVGKINKNTYHIGNKALIEKSGLWSKAADELSTQFGGEGSTVVFVANDKRVLGGILLADEIKPESKEAISDLHKLGLKVAMLTGDNEQVAKSVANKLNIDAYYANVLPKDKYKQVKNLQDKGNSVMMVGDGVNDAPALTQANIGIAIGAGTDVAVESGDIVLTRSNPGDIVRLVVLGRKTYRKMIENLIWAFGYNIIAIPTAAGAFASFNFFLSPGLGAFLMSLSSVIVVINAFQLKKAKLTI